METLTAVELQIIRSMLVKEYGPASPFLDQLAGARVDSRRTTGVGVFVNLSLAGNPNRVDDINLEISAAYPTSLAAPLDRVGFTLFIRGGYLNFLEGCTFGDAKWLDDPMEKWLILDAA